MIKVEIYIKETFVSVDDNNTESKL